MAGGGTRAAHYAPGWTVAELLAATGGRLAVPADADGRAVRFTSVATDSREVERDGLFVALRGENVDGHDFLPEAVAQGAVAGLVERVPEASGEVPVLVVAEDAARALGRFAAWHRDRFSPRVVAVTGSVGKTTCKDMAAGVASVAGRAWKSPGNLNSDIGLPLALLSLMAEHEIAILEMAMRGAGEIAHLSGLARPEIGILTTIGEAHLELLGSVEAIADAKFELVRALPPDGLAILNADDPLQRERAHESPCPILWYGLGERSTGREGPASRPAVSADDIVSEGPRGVRFRLATPGGSSPAFIPQPGTHHVSNALAAAALGHALGLAPREIAQGLEAYEPTGMRTQIRRLGGITLLDDAYNSSPTSLRAALATLKEVAGSGHRAAVLGDMLELGPDAPRLHDETGRFCADLDALVTVGQEARAIGQGAVAAGLPMDRWVHAEDLETAALSLLERIHPGDTLLVKASRGMRFERLVDLLARRWSTS